MGRQLPLGCGNPLCGAMHFFQVKLNNSMEKLERVTLAL